MTLDIEIARARYLHFYGRKINLYQRLYDFTKNQCGACVESGCACKDNICKHVEEQASRRGARFSHTGHVLRFIGARGCIVPPHLRETCTIYLCESAQKDPRFDQAFAIQRKRSFNEDPIC